MAMEGNGVTSSREHEPVVEVEGGTKGGAGRDGGRRRGLVARVVCDAVCVSQIGAVSVGLVVVVVVVE